MAFYGYEPGAYVPDLSGYARAAQQIAQIPGIIQQGQERKQLEAAKKKADAELANDKAALMEKYLAYKTDFTNRLVTAGYEQAEANSLVNQYLLPPMAGEFKQPSTLIDRLATGGEKLQGLEAKKRIDTEVGQFQKYANTPRVTTAGDVAKLPAESVPKEQWERLAMSPKGSVKDYPTYQDVQGKYAGLSPDARTAAAPTLEMSKERYQQALGREQTAMVQAILPGQRTQEAALGAIGSQYGEVAPAAAEYVKTLPKTLLEIDESAAKIEKMTSGSAPEPATPQQLHNQLMDVYNEVRQNETLKIRNQNLVKDVNKAIDSLAKGRPIDPDVQQRLQAENIDPSDTNGLSRILSEAQASKSKIQANIAKAQQQIKFMEKNPSMTGREAATLAEREFTGGKDRMMRELADAAKARNLGPQDADWFRTFTEIQAYPPYVVDEFIQRWKAGEYGGVGSTAGATVANAMGGSNIPSGRTIALNTSGESAAPAKRKYTILSTSQ